MQKLSRGPTTRKVRRKNAMKDIVSWRLKNTELLYKRWEKCRKSALKSSWHGCLRHELVDLAFSGLQTNLQEQSQNGQGPVTDA